MLVGPVYFERFSANRPGRFYMMRKCYRRERFKPIFCVESSISILKFVNPNREVFARGSQPASPASSPMLYRRRGSLKNY